jgi:hypothetical protein
MMICYHGFVLAILQNVAKHVQYKKARPVRAFSLSNQSISRFSKGQDNAGYS